MREDPQADLHDADEFFRRGDEGDYADSQSHPAGPRALAGEQPLLEDADNLPDPALVEAQLQRRARYTRWVVALMGALSLGCLVLFATRGFGGRSGSAEAAVRSVTLDTLDAPLARKHTPDPLNDPRVQKPTKVVQDIQALSRTNGGTTGDDSSPEISAPPRVAQAAQSEPVVPVPAAAAQPAARATAARATAKRTLVTSRVQGPARPVEQASQPAPGHRNAESPAQPTPVARFPGSASSRPAGVQQTPREEKDNDPVPAVVVSKTESWAADYQPPTAQFSD